MAGAAIGTWVAGALLGVYMFALTTRVGNPHNPARTSHLPSLLLFAHPLLALTGLTLLLIHVQTEDVGTAWATFVALALTASGGAVMGAIWAKDRRKATALERAEVVEQQFPAGVVALHGLLAALTLLLTFLNALFLTLD